MKKNLLSASLLPFLILLMALTFGGCKPTEQNYRAAYDKAYEAAQRKAEAETTGAEGTRLESIDGPRSEQIGRENIAVASVIVKPADAAVVLPEEANVAVAVARYTMPTNAYRNADDLRQDFPEAFVATDGRDNYYVVIATAPSKEDAAEITSRFRSTHPDYPYLGIRSSYPPLILFLSR